MSKTLNNKIIISIKLLGSYMILEGNWWTGYSVEVNWIILAFLKTAKQF